MILTPAGIEAYLHRLGDTGPTPPDLDTLARLHVAHLRTIPFENLSIHAGEPIALDLASLFDKVAVRRRGGFCYELNGLFAALLRSLGFDVRMLSAGVMSPEGIFGPDFDHMALAVTLPEGEWLADVGFGDSFVDPLRLAAGVVQSQGSRAFRIESSDHGLVLSRQEAGQAWQAQYRFDLAPHDIEEYSAMCHYHQTSPESPFTRKRVCSIATADGRVTISDRRLIVTSHKGRVERELEGDRDWAQAFQQYFGFVPQ